MMPRPLPIEAITPGSVAPFGTMVDWTPELTATGRPFHILVRSVAPTGWRLAVLQVVQRSTQRVENHPHTEELFAPIQGCSVILLATPGPFDEARVRAFLLDRPVSLAPGVWHGNFSISEQATILIAENLEVTSEYADLSSPIEAALA